MATGQRHILPETPAWHEDFNKLLPLHLEITRNRRQDVALAGLAVSVANNSFLGANGAAPTIRVYGFNANGVPTAGIALVTYSSGQPLGIPLFYVNGVITGDPMAIDPAATTVQYVGTQITPTEFLLDIKEPYARM